MIIVLGLQGSGKTTQSELLAKRLGCPAFSMGQLLRDFADEETRRFMAKGLIVPIGKATPILEKALAAHNAITEEIILDGFPRDLVQAQWLIDQLGKGLIKFTAIIHILIPRDDAVKRLLARGRSDDNPSAIETRFHEYDKSIGTILNLFQAGGYEVNEVDGSGDIETVAKRIDKALEASKKA